MSAIDLYGDSLFGFNNGVVAGASVQNFGDGSSAENSIEGISISSQSSSSNGQGSSTGEIGILDSSGDFDFTTFRFGAGDSSIFVNDDSDSGFDFSGSVIADTSFNS